MKGSSETYRFEGYGQPSAKRLQPDNLTIVEI